jgi:hypothetical protein
MHVRLLHVEPVRPLYPVEMIVSVDGATLRAIIEWSTFERLAGDTLVNTDTVHRLIHDRHDELELAIRAQLYAQGIPLSRRIALDWDDLMAAYPLARSIRNPAPAPHAAEKA